MSEVRNERKVRVGKVVSDKMEKTIVVAIEITKTSFVSQACEAHAQV